MTRATLGFVLAACLTACATDCAAVALALAQMCPLFRRRRRLPSERINNRELSESQHQATAGNGNETEASEAHKSKRQFHFFCLPFSRCASPLLLCFFFLLLYFPFRSCCFFFILSHFAYSLLCGDGGGGCCCCCLCPRGACTGYHGPSEESQMEAQ